MELDLKDKVALVTGASGGLGLAAALALAQEGVRVAINSRARENLDKAAARISGETGHKVLVVPGELGVSNIVEQIADSVLRELGSVDILVANAGGPPAGYFLDHKPETWRKAAELTLHSAIDLCRAVIPGMKEKGWGRIIFITSIAVRQPVERLIISNTLRAGLTGFAKSISNEFGPFGITVNTVCPGYTVTERLKHLAEVESAASGLTVNEVFKNMAAKTALQRLGQPEELASLIAFLASNRAAYITGAAIPVDGGLYKGLL